MVASFTFVLLAFGFVFGIIFWLVWYVVQTIRKHARDKRRADLWAKAQAGDVQAERLYWEANTSNQTVVLL